MADISRIASSLESPQVSGEGLNPAQTAGLSALWNNPHRFSLVRCAQGTPAGLPAGIPCIGLLIEMATQHAPHFLHSITGDINLSLRHGELMPAPEPAARFRDILPGKHSSRGQPDERWRST